MSKSPHRPRRILLPLCSIAVLLLAFTSAESAGAAANRTHGAGSGSKVAIGNVRVSRDPYLAHSEPALAENPRNRNNLIAGSKMFSDPAAYRFKIGTYYSLDGGRSWHDSGLLPGFGSYATTSDVSIVFSSSGTAYVAVLACSGDPCPGDGTRSGVFVSRSTDGGKTFSAPVAVFLDTTGSFFSDKPWIAVDQSKGQTAGSIYVAWNLDPTANSSSCADPDMAPRRARAASQDAGNPTGGIVIARSTDGGHTFSPPLTLAKFTNSRSGIGAIPAVGPDGRVSVVFDSIACDSGQVGTIDLATSTDGGATFSAARAIVQDLTPLPFHLRNGTFRNITMPALAVSPVNGSMVVAWADMRNGDADILAQSSKDGGKTWSKITRVNNDRVGNGKDHFQPALAVSPNGTYTCAWFDRRYDPHNRLVDEVIAQSRSDGRTFGRNIRVTRKSWDPAIGAPEPEGKKSNTFIGDYQALAVDNKAAHPLWNDTQNGASQEIRTSVMAVRLFR